MRQNIRQTGGAVGRYSCRRTTNMTTTRWLRALLEGGRRDNLAGDRLERAYPCFPSDSLVPCDWCVLLKSKCRWCSSWFCRAGRRAIANTTPRKRKMTYIYLAWCAVKSPFTALCTIRMRACQPKSLTVNFASFLNCVDGARFSSTRLLPRKRTLAGVSERAGATTASYLPTLLLTPGTDRINILDGRCGIAISGVSLGRQAAWTAENAVQAMPWRVAQRRQTINTSIASAIYLYCSAARWMRVTAAAAPGQAWRWDGGDILPK